MTRKLDLKVGIALLATLVLAFICPKTAQASTNTAIYSTTNATLKLNYNSYIYDQNGKRVPWFIGYYGKQTYLKKGSTIYTNRLIEPTSRDVRYYLRFTNKYHSNSYGDKYWLPYRKINGNYFYYIGYGAYIKARNVDRINNIIQYSNGEKLKVHYTASNGKASVLTYDSESKSVFYQRKVKKGDFLTIDGIRIFTESDSFVFADLDDYAVYAHIKGTESDYVPVDDFTDKDISLIYSYPGDNLDPRVNVINVGFQEEYFKEAKNSELLLP